mgnify:CR=1 FL=1
MSNLLGLTLLSFIVTSVFLVPFIDLLFFLKRTFQRFETERKSETPIHDQLMKKDIKIPSGAGILLIITLSLLSILYALFTPGQDFIKLSILLFSLLSFGILGALDDIKLILTQRRGKFFGLGRLPLLILQTVLAIILAAMLYAGLGFNNLYIPLLGNFIINGWFIPIAAFVIVAFANAYNISDGLDGLSAGLLLICLFAFLALSQSSLDLTLASFIGIWIGALLAFLYFNVYPARIFLGDGGAFAFGATLAVVGLLTGKILALAIIGGMFVVIVASSLLQILFKLFLKRKLLAVSPIHMYFKYIGWEEPKIVARFYLAQALFSILGLWIALISK